MSEGYFGAWPGFRLRLVALDGRRLGQAIRASLPEPPFPPHLAIDFPDDYRLPQFPRPSFFFLSAFGYASADSVARVRRGSFCRGSRGEQARAFGYWRGLVSLVSCDGS